MATRYLSIAHLLRVGVITCGVAFLSISVQADESSTKPGEDVRTVLRGKHGPAPFPLQDEFLVWPLAKENQAYAGIDGHKIWSYVSDLANISKAYRDQGHQYWGRITGTSADAATQKWVLDKLKADGITDIKVERHSLPKQWLPSSWNLSVTAGEDTFTPTTTFPVMMTSATPGDGLDLPAIYLGTGSPADLAGRDVKGKIAVIYSNEQPAMWNNTAQMEGAALLAEQSGAAGVVIFLNLPVNATTALYPINATKHTTTFSVGSSDGLKIREMLANSGARIKMSLRLETPDVQTSTIFATLPGVSDETIYIVSHRDGFFEGGADNASGVATMIGLADYFAKRSKSERRRSLVFVSTTGHHNNCTGLETVCTSSGLWIKEHAAELFSKTALLINSEHVATAQTYQYLGPSVRIANTQNEATFWYVGGSKALQQLAYDTYRSFGIPTYAEPEMLPAGEMGYFFDRAPSLQLLDVGMFAHTDKETADIIPWTGLESVTRAYAKIIDAVNKMTIAQLH